jgi:DNA ligase-1
VPRSVATDVAEVEAAFAGAVTAGFEGAVVKKLHAPYAAGRRDSGWIKLKPRHTFDLAVIAAEWGYGRRQGWLSNLHLAARDPRTGDLVMLGKTFKGLTDAMLTWQTEQFLAREVRRTKTTVFVDPPLVAEIAFDGVQASTRYPGGVALRFARVLRYRDDKAVDEVDTIDAVVALGAPAQEPS